MKKISADLLLPMDAPPIPNGVIHIDDSGVIRSVEQGSGREERAGEHYRGVLLPGWVNAHCHLELSHMRGIIPSGTGLIGFITQVVRQRESAPDQTREAIHRQDEYMYQDGIMAVGDISNLRDTVEVKAESPIRYHTFVEVFDLLQEGRIESILQEALTLRESFESTPKNRAAIVPHAPYSVSRRLFERIDDYRREGEVLSMHNQETRDEDLMFVEGAGGFPAFFSEMGLALTGFTPPGISSLQHVLPLIGQKGNTLLVHNTCTKREDVQAALVYGVQPYFVTCPNANLYIENRLPDYRQFLEAGATMCIGTDSLSSNWQLSIMEEVKTILKYNSYLPWQEVLRWATLHGARALGMDDDLGSLTPGKAPGILHLDMNVHAPDPWSTLEGHLRIL